MRRHVQGYGRTLNREAPIRPARRIGRNAIDLRRSDSPTGAQLPDSLTLEATATRRREAFLVENLRNRLVHRAGGIQLRDPLPQLIEIGVVVVGVNTALHSMLAGCTGLPDDLEPDMTFELRLVEDHLSNDEAQDALAVGGRRRDGVPHLRQVLAESPKGIAIVVT